MQNPTPSVIYPPAQSDLKRQLLWGDGIVPSSCARAEGMQAGSAKPGRAFGRKEF